VRGGRGRRWRAYSGVSNQRSCSGCQTALAATESGQQDHLRKLLFIQYDQGPMGVETREAVKGGGKGIDSVLHRHHGTVFCYIFRFCSRAVSRRTSAAAALCAVPAVRAGREAHVAAQWSRFKHLTTAALQTLQTPRTGARWLSRQKPSGGWASQWRRKRKGAKRLAEEGRGGGYGQSLL
jgi:hypothetical protein